MKNHLKKRRIQNSLDKLQSLSFVLKKRILFAKDKMLDSVDEIRMNCFVCRWERVNIPAHLF